MKKFYSLVLMGVILVTSAYAQETFLRNDVQDERDHAFAFTHATIVPSPGTKLENATLLIKKGKIEAVGTNISVPKGYTVIDVDGKFIYPSFIDMYSDYGMPKVERARRSPYSGREQIQSKTKGAYNANEAIKAEFSAAEAFTVNDKAAMALRKSGFGTVATFRADGVARGASTVVTLDNDRPNEVMIKEQGAAHYSFNKGSSTQGYPVSQMGYISLLRQTYLDAEWYGSQNPRPFTDQSLEAWIDNQDLPQVFEATNWMTALRADKVGDEFGVQYIIKGGGNEYQRIDDIKASGASFILPLSYPNAFDVSDPLDAELVSLKDMKHWEMAPSNPHALEKAGITFTLTTHGLKDKGSFLGNLRKAIKMGLTKETALAALTNQPAKMLGVDGQVGSLEKGKLANFLVTSGEIFDKKTVIHQNWIQGKNHHFKDLSTKNYAGAYTLRIGDESHDLRITGEAGKHKAHIQVDDTTKKAITFSTKNDWATINVPNDKKENIRLSGYALANDAGWKGQGQLVDGTWISWQASPNTEAEVAENKKKKGEKPEMASDIGKVIYPFLPFGSETLPQQEDILITNATVWTMEDEGILENTDVLIEDGKIKKIGQSLKARGAKVIDGTGKHLTPGIVDEHSHVGGGGNEILTNSGLVRIGDQVNSEDIGIYRALAGGVTTIQVLHGSANPIGGQSALIKLRWGQSPEKLKIEGADRFIKFALGENVKRSRSSQSIRYPQTRMGVEQVYVDAFSQARDYENTWRSFEEMATRRTAEITVKPRRDLAIEAMRDIINEDLFITCHSYVQSEINMLMDVADRFDFRVNTFTHILEGYKVADKMAKHGVGGSTFSDWWNYKWEVRYAIPYNAAIMHREGVVTAINSDSGELMRRLNTEAAKAVKYGGIDEVEAFKMVTLNPAKLLHLDDQLGSIKVGKDGDVVLWNDHPMSMYASADKTIIDGTIYFDKDRDKLLRDELRIERARLIQKMKDAKKSGATMRRGGSSFLLEMHCEDVLGEDADHFYHNH